MTCFLLSFYLDSAECPVSVPQSWVQQGACGHEEAGTYVHVALQWRRKRRMQLLSTHTMSMHPKHIPKPTGNMETIASRNAKVHPAESRWNCRHQPCPREVVRWKWANEQRWSLTEVTVNAELEPKLWLIWTGLNFLVQKRKHRHYEQLIFSVVGNDLVGHGLCGEVLVDSSQLWHSTLSDIKRLQTKTRTWVKATRLNTLKRVFICKTGPGF